MPEASPSRLLVLLWGDLQDGSSALQVEVMLRGSVTVMSERTVGCRPQQEGVSPCTRAACAVPERQVLQFLSEQHQLLRTHAQEHTTPAITLPHTVIMLLVTGHIVLMVMESLNTT